MHFNMRCSNKLYKSIYTNLNQLYPFLKYMKLRSKKFRLADHLKREMPN